MLFCRSRVEAAVVLPKGSAVLPREPTDFEGQVVVASYSSNPRGVWSWILMATRSAHAKEFARQFKPPEHVFEAQFKSHVHQRSMLKKMEAGTHSIRPFGYGVH